MKAVFSTRAFTAVKAETTEKVTTETGGLFLGIYEEGTWYIIETIDPGPNSIFQVAYFEYDQKYTQHLMDVLCKALHFVAFVHYALNPHTQKPS